MMRFLGFAFIFFHCSGFCKTTTSEQFSNNLVAEGRFEESENGVMPVPIMDYNCEDMFGNRYIKDVPHPTNCNLFLKCEETISGMPRPVTSNCPPTLHFSLTTCACDFPREALCFDNEDPTHVPIRMDCACPLVQAPNKTWVPDFSDKRCRDADLEFSCAGYPDGIYPNIGDCRTYYMCSGNVRTLHNCNSDLKFDKNLLVCVHPQDANCATDPFK